MDIFFVKRNAAYEMRISDWSSDLCSSDLLDCRRHEHGRVVDGQILDVLRETLGELVHAGGDLLRNGDGVGAGRLVDADRGAGLAVEAAELVGGLGAALDPGDVPHAHHRAVRKTGSAACRERWCLYVSISLVAVSLKQQKKLQ